LFQRLLYIDSFVVRITDENASKKAFDNLTSALEKEHITFEEAE